MKIVDWLNIVSKKYDVSSFETLDDLYANLKDIEKIDNNNNVFENFYAMYVFNRKQDVIVMAFSHNGKDFSKLDYYMVGEQMLEMKNGKTLSFVDAGIEFVKTIKDNTNNNIENWEKFYINNFVSTKLDINEVHPKIIEDYINDNTKPNIETITEGFIDEDLFHSCYLIGEKGEKPKVLIVLASCDGETIYKHFAIKIDKKLSFEKHARLLEDLFYFDQESKI